MATEQTRGETVSERLNYWGRTDSDTPAFIFWSSAGRSVFTRGETAELSKRFAHKLSRRGVEPGDIVCVALHNSPARLVVDFGIQMAGAVPMNGQILRADGEDLIETMRKSKCKVLVVDPDTARGPWEILQQHCTVETTQDDFAPISSQKIPDLHGVQFCRCHKPENKFLTSLEGEDMLIRPSRATDPAFIFTTSGTGGYTKLVLHNHKNLLRFGEDLNDVVKTQADETYCSCAPLGWLGGYPFNFLHRGSPRVLIDDSSGAASIPDRLSFVWEMLRKESVTTATMMPLHYIGLYNRSEIWSSSPYKLKKLLSGGQAVKRAYLDVMGKLAFTFSNLYAASEFGVVSSLEVTDANKDTFEDCMVGYPPEGVEFKIVDENGDDLPTTSRGKIVIRSRFMFREYVGQTTDVLQDGWFQIDDVGYLTPTGCLVVEGRASDAIMHGGYILYPYWLENKLAKCPGVKDVLIVPVPDHSLGQEICACVKIQDGCKVTSENLINFCKSEMNSDISSKMKFIPKYVLMLEAIPLTKTLKLDRKQTAMIAKEKLGL